MPSRDDFGRELCHRLKAPYFIPERRAFLSWAQAEHSINDEGPRAAFNPLNTTLELPGSTLFNTLGFKKNGDAWGVQNYVSLEQGVYATAKTINDGADAVGNPYGYKEIRRRLRLIAPAYYVLEALEASKWGTGALAIEVLPFVRKNPDPYANAPV